MVAPLLKWTGGKRSELPILQPLFPTFNRIIEPFAGGAAVALASGAQELVLNDVSGQLVSFYQSLQDSKKHQNFLALLQNIHDIRQLIAKDVKNLSDQDIDDMFVATTPPAQRAISWATSKWPVWAKSLPKVMQDQGKKDIEKSIKDKCATRIPNLEKKREEVFTSSERRQHVETALQAGFYTLLRRLYNGENLLKKAQQDNPMWDVASWFVVRGLCYSGMFRYGKNGAFNVPYGGIGYNSRDFTTSIKHLKNKEVLDVFSRTHLHNIDFEELFKNYHYFDKQQDFIFVDPPYDSTFSQYNKEGDFTQDDQKRLAKTLKATKAPWMLVIKNTPFILNLYDEKNLYHAVFGKQYQVNFRNRHDRGVEHLIVTNYPMPQTQDITFITPQGYFP